MVPFEFLLIRHLVPFVVRPLTSRIIKDSGSSRQSHHLLKKILPKDSHPFRGFPYLPLRPATGSASRSEQIGSQQIEEQLAPFRHDFVINVSWARCEHQPPSHLLAGTKETVKKLPLLATKAGPRDKALWEKRLKEELQALIKYIQLNKASDSDWFTIKSSKGGLEWSGKCWYVHNLQKYEFSYEFEIPATYPATAPEIRIPELEGKTAKMYRGGAICLTVHFKPLWAKNSPHFGLCHALCLGLAPWLAAEIPYLIDGGVIQPQS